MDLRTCAYPGCDVKFTPTNNCQRYHDRRESWRLSNRKWAAANPEKKHASHRAWVETPHGQMTHYISHRDWQLRQMRARLAGQLAALKREETESA